MDTSLDTFRFPPEYQEIIESQIEQALVFYTNFKAGKPALELHHAYLSILQSHIENYRKELTYPDIVIVDLFLDGWTIEEIGEYEKLQVLVTSDEIYGRIFGSKQFAGLINTLAEICLEQFKTIRLDHDSEFYHEYMKINRAIEKEIHTLYPRRFPRVFANAKNFELRMIGGDSGKSRTEIFEKEAQKIFPTLSDRDQLIIKLRFGFEGQEKLSYSKIGEIVGMTKLGVMKAVRRILNKSGRVVKKNLHPSEK